MMVMDSVYWFLFLNPSLMKGSSIIGLESTAHCGDNLIRYLVAFFIKCVLNPIKMSTMRKNNIRKTKTDKIDTYIITKTLMLQIKFLAPQRVSTIVMDRIFPIIELNFCLLEQFLMEDKNSFKYTNPLFEQPPRFELVKAVPFKYIIELQGSINTEPQIYSSFAKFLDS